MYEVFDVGETILLNGKPGVNADAEDWDRMRRKHFLHQPNTGRYWRLVHTIGGWAPGDPEPEWVWIDEATLLLLEKT